MPKQISWKVNTDSPGFICIAYTLAALAAILVFRLFFPNAFVYDDGASVLGTDTQILSIFRIGNSLTRGLLNFISFFPAIFMSAQFIPFRKIPSGKSRLYQRFSPEFFKLLFPQLIIALASTIVYSLLFLIVRPICADYQVDIRTGSALFLEAKKKAIFFADNEDWLESSRFLLVCERIWPLSDELADLREVVDLELTRVRYNRTDGRPAPSSANVPEQQEPVTVSRAIMLAETAIAEERYYDAHRLATIAERLAPPGSVESIQATRLAGVAWNAIDSLEPTITDRERYALYRLKREGYEAMSSGDWARAYYIFRDLMGRVVNDPDVQNFFQMCAENIETIAFFVDEIDTQIATELAEPVFSLPLFEASGRVVMRLASLSSTADYSYGKGFEMAAFDSGRNPLYNVEAPYVKLLPFYINGRPYTVVYLQALNRDYEDIRWGPSWSGVPPEDVPQNQIVLAISYEDFLLASVAGRNLDGFFLSDIWTLSKRLASYGYMPEVYQAEILRSIMDPLLFLPLIICIIVIGWRFRCRKRHSLAIFPMFFLMPVLLNASIQMFRKAINACGLFTILSFGFTTALTAGFIVAFLLFALSVLILTSQRS